MNHSRVQQKVESRQRISDEEVMRQHVALQSVTGAAGGDEVSVGGQATAGARVHVIDRRTIVLEPRTAVHAAPAAIAHHGALESSLEINVLKVGGTTPAEESARRTGEADAMNAVPSHCTSPKRTTPRAGWGTRTGRRVRVNGARRFFATSSGRRRGGSEEGRRSTIMRLRSRGGWYPVGTGSRAPYECGAERHGARARRVRLSYSRR
jgi:hypothetical protein